MEIIQNCTFDQERAFYGSRDIKVIDCKFDGEADGESAFKESINVEAENCFFNLRYPFWHDDAVLINNCDMTSLCRAALWYSDNIVVKNTLMHGIKALRECKNIYLENVDIDSTEFGWLSKKIKMVSSAAQGEYFMFGSENIDFCDIKFKGKYSFQYIKNAILENCTLETKDAFWHAKNVTIKNCVIKGEYLAWYSENLTFENCIIYGTQPFCYCKKLKLINCEMHDADLAFEKSEVDAVITKPIISIKNPAQGKIVVPSAEAIIRDDSKSKCEILFV